jgi:hypothetical protein
MNAADAPPAHRLSRSMPPALDPTLGARREPVRRLWPALVAGIAVLALLNAQGLEKWAARLPGTTLGNAILIGAQHWHDGMRAIGAAGAFERARAAFRALRDP